MPAICKTDESLEYAKLLTDPFRLSLGEGNDCSLIAACLLTGKTYQEVYSAYKSAGRKDKEGTWYTTDRKAYAALGFRLIQDIWFTEKMIKTYPKADQILKHITTHHPRRFKKAWKPWVNHKMLLHTTDHAVAFLNGSIHDFSVNKALRVTGIYYVVEAGQSVTTAHPGSVWRDRG